MSVMLILMLVSWPFFLLYLIYRVLRAIWELIKIIRSDDPPDYW